MADPFGQPGSDVRSRRDVIKYYGITVYVFAYILNRLTSPEVNRVRRSASRTCDVVYV
jgi:hypothetical protein